MTRALRRIALLASSALAVALCGAPAAGAAPPIHHVFVIVLENESYDTTFGPSSPAPYLSKTLPKKGALVKNYYGIGHASLDNYVAMISGQAPNPQTQGDCQQYTEFVPGIIGTNGEAVGQGCVYPTAVKTISNQMDAKGLRWRGYMQDMGADPAREAAACAHPAINSTDHTQVAEAKDQYATRHDPFVYFHSIIDDQQSCKSKVVQLSKLKADLKSVKTTPNLVFVTPDLCNDGHDATCADGGPGGLTQVNNFLKIWAPRIVKSKAFRKDGLLIFNFDEAAASDGSACCGEQAGPNTVLPGISGPGGGRTGAVMLSRYIKAGTVSSMGYNHYSLLRSIEDLMGVSHLGFAADSNLRPFGRDIFTAPKGKKIPKL